ncbi:uncharacterized protein LOC122565860 [Bombus pyrosoma]|uniref:uncharacterized protein LOC122565860 n=1 Tax=Bombus pyrosoma TaxID=396416 RepID=UPI001CB9A27E|nr:uncharacterized protein LOC122565860 [Bombus pyrosoma]
MFVRGAGGATGGGTPLRGSGQRNIAGKRARLLRRKRKKQRLTKSERKMIGERKRRHETEKRDAVAKVAVEEEVEQREVSVGYVEGLGGEGGGLVVPADDPQVESRWVQRPGGQRTREPRQAAEQPPDLSIHAYTPRTSGRTCSEAAEAEEPRVESRSTSGRNKCCCDSRCARDPLRYRTEFFNDTDSP